MVVNWSGQQGLILENKPTSGLTLTMNHQCEVIDLGCCSLSKFDSVCACLFAFSCRNTVSLVLTSSYYHNSDNIDPDLYPVIHSQALVRFEQQNYCKVQSYRSTLIIVQVFMHTVPIMLGNYLSMISLFFTNFPLQIGVTMKWLSHVCVEERGLMSEDEGSVI